MAADRINLGAVTELEQTQIQCVEQQGEQYVLIHQQGEFFLLDNHCPHKAAALCEGELSNHEIQCPWHKAKFDIRTGRGLSPLAGKGVNSWPLTVEDGQLFADMTAAI